jgi:hypothetical protein
MRDACQVTGKPEVEAESRIQETGQPMEQEIGDRTPDAGGEGPGAKL